MITALSNLAGIVGILGFIIFIIYRFRSDGKTSEKLKNSEAINDQNDELLEYLKKEKDFIHRMRNPDELERVRLILNQDNNKK